MTDSKTANGMRMWEVTSVKSECPTCGYENSTISEEFTTDEMWYQQPATVECFMCNRLYEIEVNDDDR